jgi:putative acetyltransferase
MGATVYRIAVARPADVPLLQAIELAAARLFEGHASESVLVETTSQQDLELAQTFRRLWVALAGDTPVGLAHVELFEPTAAHLSELDVHPDHGRRGLGTRLVNVVCDWAAGWGYRSVTLSTFRDVPWNMPFYARLGFEVIPPEEGAAISLAVVRDEIRRGLDSERRVVMRRMLGSQNARPAISLAADADRPRLMTVWEASVRATHHFLSERDLELLIPLARQELARIAPVHCLRDARGSVCAFMAVEQEAIQALFVDPLHRGQGAGRRLVEHAIAALGARRVDVNEQNHLAVGFYEHMGFHTRGRSPLDAQGLPFPLLHMDLSV